MKVFGTSDLHLDINKLTRDGGGKLVPRFNSMLTSGLHKNDLLLIAGDTAEIHSFQPKHFADGSETGYFLTSRVMEDFKSICAAFKQVIMIMGNHEFYNDYLHLGYHNLRELTKEIPNLTLADNDVIDVDGKLQVITTVLWTDLKQRDPLIMQGVKYGLNDYNYIKKFDQYFDVVRIEPADTADLYEKNRAFLTKAINDIDPDGTVPVIVMTHHAPVWAHVNDQRYDMDSAILNYAYAATDLEDLVLDNQDKVALYFHGHTHDQRATPIGNTMVVTHARGYHEPFFAPLLLLDTEV